MSMIGRPHSLPAHQYSGSNSSMIGNGASSARTSDASPMRANAPADTIAVVDPRSSSSSTGFVPTSEGTSGSRASA